MKQDFGKRDLFSGYKYQDDDRESWDRLNDLEQVDVKNDAFIPFIPNTTFFTSLPTMMTETLKTHFNSMEDETIDTRLEDEMLNP